MSPMKFKDFQRIAAKNASNVENIQSIEDSVWNSLCQRGSGKKGDFGFKKCYTQSYIYVCSQCNKIFKFSQHNYNSFNCLHLGFNPVYSTDSEESLMKSDEPWNMNNFTEKHSIINVNSIDNRIAGVQTSFVNVGMQGTFFCAHKEDSNIASLNILLEGAPKIWYVLPYSQAEKFEQLFEELDGGKFICKTSLNHKCCIIPPWILSKHGIKFTKHIQKPGEIMFTLYGAYHFGFNCGLNVCESANIASPIFINFHKKATLCKPPCGYFFFPLTCS